MLITKYDFLCVVQDIWDNVQDTASTNQYTDGYASSDRSTLNVSQELSPNKF